jgi:hypothetical protein
VPDLVRPVIFDALVEELGFAPFVPAEPMSTTQALPVVEPITEPFQRIEGRVVTWMQ